MKKSKNVIKKASVIEVEKPSKKNQDISDKEKKLRMKYLGFIFLFAFILYGNTIPNDYSFDDIYVTNNEQVRKGFDAISNIFTSLYANLYEDGKPLTFGYRPVVQSTFAIEYGFFGANPHVSHLINILLYALTGILLFNILRKLLKDYNIVFPFMITLLFMGHPAHTEVVSSLKNRDELITFLSCIASLMIFIKFIETNKIKFILYALLLYIIGYLAKPTVIIFIVVFPLVFYYFTDAKLWKIILIVALVFGLTYLLKTIPRMYLPEPNRPVQFIENPLVFAKTPLVKIATGFNIMLFYMRMIIFPHPLVFYYGYNMIPIVNLTNFLVILSIVIHVGLFIYAIRYFLQKTVLSFGILIYLVSIGTFSNILKPAMGIVADRFLYFPSFGFSIIIAYLIFKIFKTDPKNVIILSNAQTKIVITMLIILIPYTLKTIDRNRDWDTQITLLNADIGNLEKSAKANLIYAGTMNSEVMQSARRKIKLNPQIKRQIELVFKHLELAIKIYPDYYQAYNMLGNAYISYYKNYDKALENFLKSNSIKPDYFPAYYNIAYTYEKKGETGKAIEFYKKTLEVEPNNFQANKNMANIFKDLGDYDNALYYNNRTREIKDSLDNQAKIRN